MKRIFSLHPKLPWGDIIKHMYYYNTIISNLVYTEMHFLLSSTKIVHEQDIPNNWKVVNYIQKNRTIFNRKSLKRLNYLPYRNYTFTGVIEKKPKTAIFTLNQKIMSQLPELRDPSKQQKDHHWVDQSCPQQEQIKREGRSMKPQNNHFYHPDQPADSIG